MQPHVMQIEHFGYSFLNSAHGILLVTGMRYHYVLFLP